MHFLPLAAALSSLTLCISILAQSLLLLGWLSVSAKEWQAIPCSDGLNNQIEVSYKRGTYKYSGGGSDQNNEFNFKIFNGYSVKKKVWLLMTMRRGNGQHTWTMSPVTILPNQSKADSIALYAYGLDIISCKISFSQPTTKGGPATIKSVDEVTFPGPIKRSSNPTQKRKRSNPK